MLGVFRAIFSVMMYPRQQISEQWAAQLNFAGLEQQHGLPAGVLTNLVRQESRGNCDARSPVGAQGLCQFMPATARAMGVNASDPVSSINGAARYLEQLMDMFDGDAQKAIAAYNWGPGNMRRNVREHGSDWKNYLPAETKHYLEVVGSGVGSTYVQRRAARTGANGQVTPDPEDDDREAERRRNELREAGLSTDMSKDGLLGALFFMLIKGFLESKLGSLEGQAAPATAPDRETPSSETPAVVVPRTPAPTPPPGPAQVAGVGSARPQSAPSR